MNLWHDIEAGTENEINVIIEIPKGSKNKYEIDKRTGLIALDRVMRSAQDFPFDYGFVPQTLWHDGDALDVMILATYPFPSGILVRVRPVALMEMFDSGDNDNKLLAVPVDDVRWDGVQDLKDVNPHTLKEIEHFYSTYKKLQDKEVTVKGFHDKTYAVAAFKEGQALYKEKFSK